MANNDRDDMKNISMDEYFIWIEKYFVSIAKYFVSIAKYFVSIAKYFTPIRVGVSLKNWLLKELASVNPGIKVWRLFLSSIVP